MLVDDPVAHALLAAAAVLVVAGELLASYIGQTRGGRRLFRRTRDVAVQDRGTKLIVAFAAYLGIGAAIVIAKAPALRHFANTWWTFGLGLAIALAGAALRDWSIVSLGRYFRREVTIEPGQTIVRRGPYRLLRHPSYTGLILMITGFGLAIGSWLGAAAALVIVTAGLLPRIRVEEEALAHAFGADYTTYASSTSRLLPHVW
jgi:protein-S-isoprenylcysteine O-methyltransferase Ste14